VALVLTFPLRPFVMQAKADIHAFSCQSLAWMGRIITT
jgi:hypothetical protein